VGALAMGSAARVRRSQCQGQERQEGTSARSSDDERILG